MDLQVTMIDNNSTDASTIDRICAMRSQEEKVRCRKYYFRKDNCSDVDESCRKLMVEWCQKVQVALDFSPDVVWIAMSFFDRYLSSGKGKSQEVLGDKNLFQLCSIATFYMAVKLYEPVEFDAGMIAKVCQDYYSATEINSFEEDILFALDWRVTSPTPMEYARQFIELLPNKVTSSVILRRLLLKSSQSFVTRAAADYYFTFCKASVIGASCLVSSLTGSGILSRSEREKFLHQLEGVTDYADIATAKSRLLREELHILREPGTVTKNHPSYKGESRTTENSSPVCVTQRELRRCIISRIFI